MPEIEEEVVEHCFCVIFGVLSPPFIPPRAPRSPPGRAWERAIWIFSDQNFDHFLNSVLNRFWVVWGCHLEVMVCHVGSQVGHPSAIWWKT